MPGVESPARQISCVYSKHGLMKSRVIFQRLSKDIYMSAIEGAKNDSWMRWVLYAAGIYNMVWGAVAITVPLWMFRAAEMELPRYPEFWQCIGIIVGVYGIGYIIAASDPIRHWPIVFVGFLGKVLGPIGFAEALWSERLPLVFGLNIVTNDLIWWIPFSLILLAAWRNCGHS